MTVLLNSYEGGTNGTTITTGNSGGASGNAFDEVSLGGGTLIYSSTHAAHGTLSAEVSSSATTYAGWTTSLGTQATVWFRDYLYLTANPAAALNFLRFLDSGVATCASIQITTGGTLQFLDASSTARITTTATVALNAWFRVEGFITASATLGQVSLSLYNAMDSITPTEMDTSAATLNTHGGMDEVRFGLTVGGTSETFWFDDIGVSTTGYIGPIPVVTTKRRYGSIVPSLVAAGVLS